MEHTTILVLVIVNIFKCHFSTPIFRSELPVLLCCNKKKLWFIITNLSNIVVLIVQQVLRNKKYKTIFPITNIIQPIHPTNLRRVSPEATEEDTCYHRTTNPKYKKIQTDWRTDTTLYDYSWGKNCRTSKWMIDRQAAPVSHTSRQAGRQAGRQTENGVQRIS